MGYIAFVSDKYIYIWNIFFAISKIFFTIAYENFEKYIKVEGIVQ